MDAFKYWASMTLLAIFAVSSLEAVNQCYHCRNGRDNDECNRQTPETCGQWRYRSILEKRSNSAACEVEVYTINGRKIIKKKCIEGSECYSPNVQQCDANGRRCSYCCYGNLCNGGEMSTTTTREPTTPTRTWPTTHPTRTWPTTHPTRTWPTTHPTRTWPTTHPTRTWPTTHPTRTWATSHPTRTWPTTHPNRTWPITHPTRTWPTTRPTITWPTTQLPYPGLPGPTGPVGPIGQVGPKGEKGDTGSPGQPGRQGVDGDKGDTGSPGHPGLPGSAIPGQKGDPGLPGTNGMKGMKGEVDKDYLATLKGQKGDVGDKGQPGHAGPTGDTGDCECPDETIEAYISFTVAANGVQQTSTNYEHVPIHEVLTNVTNIVRPGGITPGYMDFIAPIHGLYIFHLTSIANGNGAVPLILFRGQDEIITMTGRSDRSATGVFPVGNTHTALELDAGETVNIVIKEKRNGFFWGSVDVYSPSDITFSGFLLAPLSGKMI